MTRTKTAKPKKITGVVGALTAQQIRVAVTEGEIWNITRTRTTKVTVISGKPLRRGSRVTVEFKTGDGKKVGTSGAGKRTETGTVIGLTDQQIKLQTATDETWIISRTDDNTVVKEGTLTLHSDVMIEFAFPPGHLA